MRTPEKRSIEEVAIGILSRREHSVQELRQKLRQRKFEAQEIAPLLVRLIEKGFLSEERYMHARSRALLRNGFGPQVVQRSLQQEGIAFSAQQIEEVREEIGLDDLTQIRDLIEKKIRRFFLDGDTRAAVASKSKAGNEEFRKFKQRLLGMLVRKGFSFGASQKCIELLLKEIQLEMT